MAETIGSRMRATREAKGMSIEDVAFATRIHASHIWSLEADDYSGFASTTYAKSFLSLYSRFLGVDAAEALHYFAGTDDIRLGGNTFLPTVQPIQSTSAPRNRAPESRQRSRTNVQRESPGLAPLLMGFVVLLLLAGIPALWFLGKDAESIDDVTTKAKGIADATRTEIASAGENVSAFRESNDANAAPQEPPVETVVTAAPLPEPAENPDATPTTKPGGAEKSRGPRSVAADWVLENRAEHPAEKPKAEPLGGNSGESTLDTKPVNESVSDPGPSTAVAVAIPTTPSLESEISPPRTAKPVSELPDAFDAASRKPTPEASETEENRSAPQPALPIKRPAASTPTPKPVPLRAEPSMPSPDSPPAPPIVASPLRAVPFIATPIEEEPAGEATEETENEADRDRPTFFDPRNRFPRPLE